MENLIIVVKKHLSPPLNYVANLCNLHDFLYETNSNIYYNQATLTIGQLLVYNTTIRTRIFVGISLEEMPTSTLHLPGSDDSPQNSKTCINR